MTLYADKIPVNKSQFAASTLTKIQNTASAIKITDNRPEAVAQRKQQEAANSSPQVSRLSVLQEMTNSSSVKAGQPIQAKWILRDKQKVNVPDDYVLVPPEELSSPPILEAMVQDPGLRQLLFSNLSVPDTINLGRASNQMHKAVGQHSVVPRLQGRRTVAGQDFWSELPSTEPKRYFQTMSGAGSSAQIPHISEQAGFDNHLTDVAAVDFGPQRGIQPGKIQFPMAAKMEGGYQLGSPDVPSGKQWKNTGLQPAPVEAQELPDTYIRPQEMNKAKRNALIASDPRTRITKEQASQPLDEVSKKWEGQKVRVLDRPQ